MLPSVLRKLTGEATLARVDGGARRGTLGPMQEPNEEWEGQARALDHLKSWTEDPKPGPNLLGMAGLAFVATAVLVLIAGALV
jgi:hypothetical protein